MRHAIIVALLVINTSKLAFAIECVLCDENSCNNQCIGDYCKISNSTVAHSRSTILQGCYTGDLPGPRKPACYRTVNENGDEMVECYCNRTTCNNIPLMQESKVTDFGPIACELMRGGEKKTQSCEGAYCEMSYSIQDDGPKNVSKGCVNTAFPSMMPLELKPDPPPACISMTTTLGKQDDYFISVQCTCASAMCNKDEMWLKQLPSSKPNQQVNCYQQQCTAPEGCTDYGTCQGDYCYEYNQASTLNGSDKLITMGCMNTSQLLKGKEERKIEEGFLNDKNNRLYQMRTVQICAQNYCIMKSSNAKQFVKSLKSTIGSDQKQNTDKPNNEQSDNSAQNQNNAGNKQSSKNGSMTPQHPFLTLQVIFIIILTFSLHFQ